MKNVPSLRFKEFSGEWDSKKIGEITIKVGSGKTPKGGNSVYTDEGVIFLRSQNVLNGKLSLNDVAYITEDINSTMKSTEVYSNDILLNITGASIGRSCCVPKNFGRANVNQHVCIIRLNEKYNPNFVMNQIISSKIQKQIDSFQAGGNREGLNFEQIKGMKISSTTLEEQEKIASFFSLIDKKIELQTEKVEELKNYKKGIMQKMFPRNGETVPELRFAGFTDDWEQCKVSELFKVTRGYVLSSSLTSNDKSEENLYPVYSSQTKDNGLMGYYKDYLYENAITWTTDGANAGTVNYRSGKFYCTNVCGVLVSDKIHANQMVAESLNNVAKRYVSYVGNPKLMNNVMAEIKIKLPTSSKERERMSVYFNNLDNLITLHQCKLDALNEYKKGLLQQMFI